MDFLLVYRSPIPNCTIINGCGGSYGKRDVHQVLVHKLVIVLRQEI